MAIIIGSARHDEDGKYSGGKAGDQVQTGSGNDYKGEVSMQNFYIHNKGWYVLRAKDDKIANKIAKAMKTACNNSNIGYSQSDRYGIVKAGTATKTKVNADCSSTVRTCVKEASGKDPGDFNTSTEVSVLQKTGLFKDTISYTSNTTLYTGDILVTKSKGHTVVVVEGTSRSEDSSSKKTNPYKEPTVNIKSGSTGEGAKWVQWELNQAGYSLTIDGEVGTKTVAAIKKYQKAKGLTVDGIVGAKTRAKMKND